MLQKVKPQPLAVYSAVTMKISLAVQTGAANVSVTAFSSALPPRGSSRVVRVRRRAPHSSLKVSRPGPSFLIQRRYRFILGSVAIFTFISSSCSFLYS